MTRVASIALAVLIGAAAVGSAQESQETISVRIAKTERYVSPFGTSSFGNATIVVRLFRNASDGNTLIARQRVVADQDGSYRARFSRPTKGDCLVKVHIARTKVRDKEFFPCYIPDFPMGSATLSSLTEEVTIDALIADSLERRAYGLMYRPKMRHDLGMAFLYDSQSNHGAFWMKNTLIPLSIAFVDSNGLIVRILDMEPCVEDPCETYSPGSDYQMALEVNQGAFEEWGISEGDRIEVDP